MSIDTDIAFMERVPLLGLLGRPALRVLAIGAETHRLGSGRVLFVAGEPADAGYLVQDGAFTLRPDRAVGNAQDLTVGRGALLGEMALMAETVWPTTATAVDSSVVLRITRSLFLKMLDGYPESARRLRDTLIARTDQRTRELEKVRTILTKADRDG
jgi:CRP-like cAMP-binding protein